MYTIAPILLALAALSSSIGAQPTDSSLPVVYSAALCSIGSTKHCPPVARFVAPDNSVNNCGALGTVCPLSYVNSVGPVTCTSGSCASACSVGYSFSTATQACVPTQSDIYNCGSLGTVCNTANGVPSCVAGTCSVYSCQSGFTLVMGACMNSAYVSSMANCGALDQACTPPAGAASAICLGGTCQVKDCNTGFTASTSKTTCVAVTSQNDPSNCGPTGVVCPKAYTNGIGSICSAGTCMPASCTTGSQFNAALNLCTSTATDPGNCGKIGNVCPAPPNGVAGCAQSQCFVASCTTPYILQNGVCTSGPSARAKKSKIPKLKTLCPGSETACPIVGSASYLYAQSTGFSAFRSPMIPGSEPLGGYECLDTAYALESCGGCASMDEGTNCLDLPHTLGVGCSAGSCVVFSCDKGYIPSLDGKSCVAKVNKVKRTTLGARKSKKNKIAAKVSQRAR